MKDNQLIDDLRGIGGAEPPLGFDPDRVADTAAKLHKRRRALTGVSLGVAVAVAATAFSVSLVLPGDAEEDIGMAAAPTSWPTVTVAPRQSDMPSPNVDLSKQMERLKAELPEIIEQAKPGAQLKVGRIDQYQPNNWDHVSIGVGFVGPSGEQNYNLGIFGKAMKYQGGFNLNEKCAVLVYPPVNGKPRTEEPGPGTRCQKFPRKDGSTVVVEEQIVTLNGSIGASGVPEGEKLKMLTVSHFRTDGTLVQLLGTIGVPMGVPQALTDNEAVRIVTNPGLNLN
ncbi:hypothetical protein [Crossiella sp. CA198]|uniref:hypothetical protein n=1 Tax=Crossiella sp. CA198 TaxID=3455607 RepID=UPI003F8D043C